MKGATMFVITPAQRGSRRGTDLVPAALTRLQSVRPKPIRAFDRTAGDEIQGVAEDPLTVVDVVVTLMRGKDWRLGIGIGPVDKPLPRQARAGRGPAFIAARQAVRSAHSPAQLGVAQSPPENAADRPPHPRLNQQEIAHRLGISPSAGSQRVRRSGWAEQFRAQSLATHLSVADE